ncbi:MAG: tRNA 5-methoxyuridine(34)/uridine 5-oxyacetic acid(34) synthase CmoB [bacterium]
MSAPTSELESESESDRLRAALAAADLGALAAPLLDRARDAERDHPHGDRAKWRRVIAGVADLARDQDADASHDFARAAVRIGDPRSCAETRARLKHLLLQLRPWRKGPFELRGLMIDSEWRADMKWARLHRRIGALRDRRVLDVGCGNGYYLWRMLGAGARLALGIDPSRLFVAQFDALKRHCPDCPAFVLPLSSEQFPRGVGGFDTVLSMGVLYHRRDPAAHLRELLAFARPGGEVVIETLLVDGGADAVLRPSGRYAKMRNVHAIPSPLALQAWLRDAGARDIRLLDVSATTAAEQRVTEWMQFESLTDFLDPTDPAKTIEGYPSPKRGIFVCRRSD